MPRFTVAVPGSGKTTEIVNYVDAYVTAEENPKQVLAITFTNEATSVLQKRLDYLNNEYQQVTCCTIHSLSYFIAQGTPKQAPNPKLKELAVGLQSGSVPENLLESV